MPCKKLLQGDGKKDVFARTVRVDRSRAPRQMLSATGRTNLSNQEVIECIPRKRGMKVTVEFFRFDCGRSDDELEQEFARRGLAPDPYAVAAVNEADPSLADEYPNGTYWKRYGCGYHLDFWRDVGVRLVIVRTRRLTLQGYFWFGGVSKN